jgi:large subunit ribosomal protein L29
MDAKELRALPEKELLARVAEIRERLFNLSFKATTEAVTNPSEVRELRKDVARIHTVMTERKLSSAPRPERTSRERRLVRKARITRSKVEASKIGPAKVKANDKKGGATETANAGPVAEKKA